MNARELENAWWYQFPLDYKSRINSWIHQLLTTFERLTEPQLDEIMLAAEDTLVETEE